MRVLFVLLAVFLESGVAQSQTPAVPAESPRKVVVATVMLNYFKPWPGLEKRLATLDSLVDEAAVAAERQYPDEGLDLVVLPEEAVTCGMGNTPETRSLPLGGAWFDRMATAARRHKTYLIAPVDLVEEDRKGKYANAAVLFDREGKVAGIYRKTHPVAHVGKDDLEGGVMPGGELPVFDCDFGRLGIQICYDMAYPDGWRVLARKGAEIVALTTQSPQTVRPSAYAVEGRYYVVSSTPRENASVYNPVGIPEARITSDGVLVHRIDLSYAILHWSPGLDEGRAFTKAFGDRAGYLYYPSEDTGIFWSNDPKLPIGKMVKVLGFADMRDEVERVRRLQDAARGGPPEK